MIKGHFRKDSLAVRQYYD